MIKLDLPLHQKARIKFDEEESFIIAPADIETFSFPAKASYQVIKHKISVELFVPRGGWYLYGMLGAQIDEHCESNVLVEIGSGSHTKQAFMESLAGTLGGVYLNIPKESVYSIIDGIRQAEGEILGLPRCKIAFMHSAYSIVGSCDQIITHLSKAITKLLVNNDLMLDREELSNLLFLDPATRSRPV